MSPVGCNPISHGSYISYLFTLWFITVSKLLLWSSNTSNFMVGGNHTMRNCIKQSESIRNVENHWNEAFTLVLNDPWLSDKTIAEELLTVDSCWRKECQFSLEMFPLTGQSWSNVPTPKMYMGSIHWSQWVSNKKKKEEEGRKLQGIWKVKWRGRKWI